MNKVNIKAYLIVTIQAFCLIFIYTSGFPFAYRPILLIGEMAGFILGIWAVAIMGLGNFNITPFVKNDAQLVTKGPYRLIRHPMYTALLLMVWPLIIDQFTFWRLIAALTLTIDLMLKILYEETLLKKRFAEYETYMKNTSRLIPFIY